MTQVLRERYEGRIAGVGTTSGTWFVVGSWERTPLGAFADVMVERADGHRILLAPSESIRDVVESTYVFDEVRLEPVSVEDLGGTWVVSSPSLRLRLGIGRRLPLGVLLRAIPRRLAASTAWASAVDPVAARVMGGVRTRGTAREGRREWYGATDLRAVTSASASLDGEDLGRWRPSTRPAGSGPRPRRGGRR